MYGKPFGRTAAAFGAPFLVRGDPGTQNIDLLDATGIAGTHYRRNIMRVKYILQDNRKVILPFIKD
jgi:hypothetical protein